MCFIYKYFSWLSMRQRPPPGENEHLNHIAFHCRELDPYIKWLKADGVAFADAYLPDMDMTQLFFYDPAGIQIELNFLHERISLG